MALDGTMVTARRVITHLRACIFCFAFCGGAGWGLAAEFMVSTTADAGPGSLRQAILDANTHPGGNRIRFQIPGSGVHTINLLGPLEVITSPVVIDGTTQPGYNGEPRIELNGAAAGLTPGLRIVAGDSTIRGLIINRFAGDGIRLEGLGGNTIAGNYLGTDASGKAARGNRGEGVLVLGAGANLIGGDHATNRNVISGNGDAGVYLLNTAGNAIQGNYIGTDVTGTLAVGNTNNGVILYNSPDNDVGGTSADARNLISGNRGSGVILTMNGSSGNRVRGNYIGVAVGGGAALSNAADGVTIQGAPANVIGGVLSGEGNLLSGNGKAGLALNASGATLNVAQGNFIGTDASGTFAVPNGYAGVAVTGAGNNFFGGNTASARNIISGNRQDGIFLSSGSAGNTIAGNYIGTDAAGGKALGNLYTGVALADAPANTVGGNAAGAGNLISGNHYYGISLSAGAVANVIQGNFVGTDAHGNQALKNRLSGLRIESADNTVGGGAGNLISGNGENGVFLVGAAATRNLILGNHIGTTRGGGARLGNGAAGVDLSGAPRNAVGQPGQGNVISGNGDAGLFIVDAGADGNICAGNRIGTDASGTFALPNAMEGVYIESGKSNLIGGASLGSGNLVSGNATRGIFITNSAWNILQGNWVGTQADGESPLGNMFHNLELENNALDNVIGGSGRAANTVAYAGSIYAGIRIRNGAKRNRIDGNSIFDNGALGIDLGAAGVTPNDACDADAGANNLQNFPVLTQVIGGPTAGIRGTLNSQASASYLIQFFASPECDPAGYGEGKRYLGEITVAAGAGCGAAFLARFAEALPPGWAVTATARDRANNTSEFSACAMALAPPPLRLASDGNGLSFSWPNTAAGFNLKQTSSLTAPVQWETVTNGVVHADGRFTVRLPRPYAGSRFYSLLLE